MSESAEEGKHFKIVIRPLVGRVFAKGSRHTKDLKMLLDISLLTQHYKVRIKGKAEQSRERSSALLYASV